MCEQKNMWLENIDLMYHVVYKCIKTLKEKTNMAASPFLQYFFPYKNPFQLLIICFSAFWHQNKWHVRCQAQIYLYNNTFMW